MANQEVEPESDSPTRLVNTLIEWREFSQEPAIEGTSVWKNVLPRRVVVNSYVF
ncbi:MAG: hypothetical protein ACKVHR_11805 [Pirellulales bacterium]